MPVSKVVVSFLPPTSNVCFSVWKAHIFKSGIWKTSQERNLDGIEAQGIEAQESNPRVQAWATKGLYSSYSKGQKRNEIFLRMRWNPIEIEESQSIIWFHTPGKLVRVKKYLVWVCRVYNGRFSLEKWTRSDLECSTRQLNPKLWAAKA